MLKNLLKNTGGKDFVYFDHFILAVFQMFNWFFFYIK